MKKYLISKSVSLLLVLAVLASLLPASVVSAKEDSVTYRALLVPSVDCGLKEYPTLDAAHIHAALLQADNFSEDNITTLKLDYKSSSAKATFLEAIETAFQDADDNDINIIYYSGHGEYDDDEGESALSISSSASLYASELRSAILASSLKGTYLFLLDACHSGGFAQKDVKSVLEADAETDAVSEDSATEFLDGFSAGLSAESALSQSKGSNDFLGSSRLKVLAAAGLQQYGIQWSLDGICGTFTTSICIGIGYAPANGTSPLDNSVNHSTYAADRNCDGAVTLSELYRWTKAYNTPSLTRCYPEEDDMVVVRYNTTRYCGNVMKSAVLDYPVVGNSGTFRFTLSYETTVPCTISCQLPLDGDNAVFQLLDPNHALPSSVTVERYTYTLFTRLQELTLPAGILDENTGTYRGSVEISLKTTGLPSMEHYLRLIPDVSGGTAELVPFQVIGSGDYAVITTDGDTISPDSFSTTVSTDSFTVSRDGIEELKIRLNFGEEAFSRNYEHISSGVFYSCIIQDSNGNTVRTLADKALCCYLRKAVSYYTCYFDGFNDLYWNGTDDNGLFVKTGTYMLIISATYVKYSSSGEKTETIKSSQIAISVGSSFCSVLFRDGTQNICLTTVSNGQAVSSVADYAAANPDRHFEGWYTKNGAGGDWGNLWSFTSPVKESMILYARWSPIVTFCDGTTVVSTVSTETGQTTTPIADYETTKSGYHLDGWYTKDGTGNDWGECWDFSTPVEENITLYARWSPVVTFYEGANAIYSVPVTKGTTVSPIADYDLTKSRAFFYGWYTKNGAGDDWGERWNFTSDTVQEPLNLYARWRPPTSFTETDISGPEIAADQEGNTVILLEAGCTENAEVMIAEYTNGMLSNIEIKTLVGSSETNQILSFPMNVKETCTYQVFMTKTDISPLLTKALYLTGAAIPYSVVFMEGAQIVSSTSIPSGSTASPIADYETGKPEYHFDGWYTGNGDNNNWGTLWSFTTPVKENITLYARWSPVVTFYEGATAIYSVPVTKGNTVSPIADYDLTKSRAFFYGWYTKDGTGDDWGERWNFASDTVQEPLSLYARWRPPADFTKTDISTPEIAADQEGNAVILLEVGCTENAEVMVAEYTDGMLSNIEIKTLVGSSETNQILSFPMNVKQNRTYQVFMTKTGFSPLLTEALSFEK